MGLSPTWYKFFDETVVGQHEGGYVPPSVDKETLFGMTVDSFRAYAKNIPAEQRAALPESLRSRLDSPEQFMRYVGHMLKPMKGGHQSGSGIPQRSTMEPENSNQLPTIQAAREVMYGMYFQEYVHRPMFDKLPTVVLEQSVDMGINLGPQRFRALLVKCMVESDIINEERFNTHYPYITSAEMKDRAVFDMSKNSGKYGTDKLMSDILDDLNDAPPEKLDRLSGLLTKWRGTFNKERARQNQSYEKFSNGLAKRTESFRPDVDLDATPLRVAKVQVGSEGLLGDYKVAVQFMETGDRIEYTIDSNYKFKEILQPLKEFTVLHPHSKPFAYQTPFQKKPAQYVNPYTETTVLIASDERYRGMQRAPQLFFASPEFHKEALAYNKNRGLLFTNTDWGQNPDGSLNDERSFYVVYGGPSDPMRIMTEPPVDLIQHKNNKAPEQAAMVDAPSGVDFPALKGFTPPQTPITYSEGAAATAQRVMHAKIVDASDKIIPR